MMKTSNNCKYYSTKIITFITYYNTMYIK